MTAKARIILSSLSLAVAAAGLSAQPAFAQAASITVGTVVKDTQGGNVGTVTSVDGEYLVVKTDKHEVRLPKVSFTATAEGALFGMTQAQLNAEVEKSVIDPATLLKAGAQVRDTAGGVVGTIEAVEAELATIKLPSASVKLPVASFAADSEGLVIGATAAELEAQVSAATATN